MKRAALIGLGLVAAQAVLLAIYWQIERRRSAAGDPEAALTTAPPARVTERLAPLALRTRDGGRLELARLERPTLVHFWATWCPPCRAELPGILALPERHPVEVVAIALDDSWSDVERFLDGRVPESVVLGDAAEARRAFGVASLPVTLLALPGGRIALRFDGARDWSDAGFVAGWIEESHVE